MLLDASERAKHSQSSGTLAVCGVSPEWKGKIMPYEEQQSSSELKLSRFSSRNEDNRPSG
jgi:hypothetical protein